MTRDEHSGHCYSMADIDITVPNVARVYDAFLGGKDNFSADREFVRKAHEITPKAHMGAKVNRVFLNRVVRYLAAGAGLTQFLDLGSGLPTQGNVSEIAHEIDPAIHVVHVDNDPVVYTHSKALLTDRRTTDIVVGDIRRPGEILDDPVVRKLIDFGRPVGLLMFAILHHVEDADDPARIVAQFRDAVPPGSYLAISSFRMPGPDLPELRAMTVESEKLLVGTLGSGRFRQEEEIFSWFGDWQLVEPGLVPLLQWRPRPGPNFPHDDLYHTFYGGVAVKV